MYTSNNISKICENNKMKKISKVKFKLEFSGILIRNCTVCKGSDKENKMHIPKSIKIGKYDIYLIPIGDEVDSMVNKTEYEKLQETFDKQVKFLQDTCPHEKTQWMEHWWAMGHSSGYKVEVCLNCNKTLREKPTAKERKAANQKWIDENTSNEMKGKKK